MPPATSPPWWTSTVVYQIYPRSFYDANGDGIGDIEGILDKLDVLQDLGVETLWCSPFFASPQADFGYDISGYREIAPEYGTLDDARRLIAEVHRRDMRVVFDMVMNHTSDQHPWFQASRSARDHPMRDWYIWREGRKPGGKAPPNNWKSMIGGSGWHHDPTTDAWYWATFLPFQPDLNYRNPAVKEAMFNHVRFWLDAGVDGFRLDIFNALFQDPSFSDNPWSWRPLPSESQPDGFFQKNVHTINHPDTFAFARDLRTVVDAYPDRVLIGEVFGSPETLKAYCDDGLHLVFLFETLTVPCRANALRNLLTTFESHFPAPLSPTYVLGNHDRPRRMGLWAQSHPEKARLMATFQLTARGVPFIYYGEEIGLPPSHISLKNALDPLAKRYRWVPQWVANRLPRLGILLNRDACRTPMAWTSDPHGGFTRPEATPWLPLHANTNAINVKVQRNTPNSLWHCYRRLLHIRKTTPALHAGTLEQVSDFPAPRDILVFRRRTPDQIRTVLLNASPRRHLLPPPYREASVVFSSLRAPPGPSRVDAILPWEGLILDSAVGA